MNYAKICGMKKSSINKRSTELSDMTLDRSCPMTLADQLVERLKAAIVRNRCRPGEVLPGIRKIAETVQVSEKVVRTAMHRLTAEGWVMPRRHVGPVIAERGSKGARWRVLYFTHNPYYCYYHERFIATLRMQLLREKDGVLLVAVNRYDGINGYIQLEEALKERWDLILEGPTVAKSRKMIEASGWPFATIDDSVYTMPPSVAANCVGRIDMSIGSATSDFVRECARRNVRSVVQLQCDRGAFDVTERLRIMGVDVRTERTPMGIGPDEVAHDAYAIVDRWFRRDRPRLPDVVFFTDDYVAQGGLLALLRHGIRIPEDVAVVSFANKGHLPIWDRALTRIEVDPAAHGVAVSQAVQKFLHDGQFQSGLSLGSAWIPGDTF